MSTSNSTRNGTLPVWDGNPDNLPAKGETFLYNGTEYYWEPCPCMNPNCKRPMVYTADGEKNRPMTFRVRGANQGHPIGNVLFRYGWVDKLIETDGNEAKMSSLLEELLGDAMKQAEKAGVSVDDFLASKGISVEEMMEASMEAMSPEDLGAILIESMLMAELGGEGLDGEDSGDEEGDSLPGDFNFPIGPRRPTRLM